MWFYNLFFLIIVTLFYYDFIKKKSQGFKIVIIILFFLSVLRWETGTDWLTYFNIFRDMGSIQYFFSDIREPGFKLINLIVRSITINYTINLILMGSILWGLKYYNLKMLSTMPIMVLLLQFSLPANDIFFVRQNIAVAITVYSLKYIYEKKLKLFLLIIFLASSIHSSAIICILFYPIYYYKKMTLNNYLILYYISLIFQILMIPQMILKIKKILPNKYISYLSRQENQFDLKILIKVMLITLIFFLMKKYFKNNYNKKYLLKILLFGTIISQILGAISPVFGRISNYFSIYLYILIFEIINKISNIKIKLYILTYIIILLFIMMNILWKNHQYFDLYVPYISIFEKGIKTRILY